MVEVADNSAIATNEALRLQEIIHKQQVDELQLTRDKTSLTMWVAAPVLISWEDLGPNFNQSLDSIAPIAWGDLGSNFGVAFQARHQRETRERHFAIRNDIKVHPERDVTNPANDPCPHCHVFDGLEICGCELADEEGTQTISLC